MDPGIIVGYLVAKLMGRAHRLADKQVDSLLDRLYTQVWRRLGGERALDRLARDPANDIAQEWARTSIEDAAESDPAFRHELAQLQRELQERAPDLLVYAPGGHTVVGVNRGYLVHGPVTINQGPRDPNDWSDAAPVVKVLAVLAVGLCLVGFGLFGLAVFGDRPDPGEPGFGEVPPDLPMAAGVLFAGIVLAAATSVVHGLKGRR